MIKYYFYKDCDYNYSDKEDDNIFIMNVYRDILGDRYTILII